MFEEKRKRFVIVLMTVAGFISISMLLQATGSALLFNIVMLTIFYTVLPFWICSYYFNRHGIQLRRIFFFSGIAPWILPIIGITMLVLIFSISIYWLMLRGFASLSPALIEIALTPQPLPDELWYLLSLSFIIAILAPIAEEFVFRGVILHRLMAALGLWKGIGLTSLIFSVIHVNIFGAFLFAVLASLLYVKTGTLLAPILLHIFNNSLAVYQYFVDPTFPEWLTVTTVNDLYTKTAPNLAALFVTLGLLFLIIKWLGRGLDKTEKV
ncbi:CPBP family intramembrane glutamic endopeptidase [Planococcus sp. CAU13]|uniref:CPBP family intramembrane glutamic endopeptidase n=1 Tax=Planococcus sp. CAU13 TaxID=1541197 RepID=UPI000690F528|nr:type II CAAX endopeptidase family protein [Planococcus sp. CAU13]